MPARFLPLGGGQVGIQVGSYDRKSTLIIDPVLDYSSYLGGSDDEGIFGIGFDDEGKIYVAGETSSPRRKMRFRTTPQAITMPLCPSSTRKVRL